MRDAILAWYDAQGRHLAFRGTTDPYAILVSEAMAQQTQASRAAEAWGRFLVAFPTFAALAAASPADVLRAWRGLGYNRRALALRATAIVVEEAHGGDLPRDIAELEHLPGIGPYTARAVAVLAFGQPVGAVDTNVRRVLVRSLVGDGSVGAAVGPADGAVHAADGPGAAATAARAPSPREIQAMADASVPPSRPGHWTHALMDIGAVFCKPRNPRCADCPALPWCRVGVARAASGRGDIGSATPKTPRPARTREAAVPFETTTRWLRGRILDRLRDAVDGDWVDLREAIGGHPAAAVAGALAALEREGLAQRDPADPARGRLPLA